MCPASPRPAIRPAWRTRERIIETYRNCGAPGLLGVKLGAKGALLSPAAGQYVAIDCVPPPGPVVDTTGAGDCFFAGVLTGLLRGLDVEQCGRLGAAAGGVLRDRLWGLGRPAGLRRDGPAGRPLRVRAASVPSPSGRGPG